MPLLRTFSHVDEEGKITIPSQIRRQAALPRGHVAEIAVVRIQGTGRKPHLFIHNRDHRPFISSLEVVLMRGLSEVDEAGKVMLADEIRSQANLDSGCVVEMKIHGAASQSWIVVHNRGPRRITTLQERLGTKKAGKRWQTIPFDY